MTLLCYGAHSLLACECFKLRQLSLRRLELVCRLAQPRIVRPVRKDQLRPVGPRQRVSHPIAVTQMVPVPMCP